MKGSAAALSDDDIRDFAAYFASQALGLSTSTNW
jgi:cytochrome c553